MSTLRRAATTLAAALLVAGCGQVAPPGERDPGAGSDARPVLADAQAYAQQVADETNALRGDHGVPVLEADGCAVEAALARARDLVGAGELEHAALDAVIAACAPPGGSAAENLSRAAAAPAEVVDAWSRSPGHRANLLDPALTRLGVGCVVDETGTEPQMLCSQVFLG